MYIFADDVIVTQMLSNWNIMESSGYTFFLNSHLTTGKELASHLIQLFKVTSVIIFINVMNKKKSYPNLVRFGR